jgi:hypothetical protein
MTHLVPIFTKRLSRIGCVATCFRIWRDNQVRLVGGYDGHRGWIYWLSVDPGIASSMEGGKSAFADGSMSHSFKLTRFRARPMIVGHYEREDWYRSVPPANVRSPAGSS